MFRTVADHEDENKLAAEEKTYHEEDERMQTEETRALIKTYYETLPTGDRKKLASLFTEDIVWHPPQSTPIGVIEGPEAVAAELGGDTRKNCSI